MESTQDEVRALLQHSRGKEFLRQRKYKFWYTYGEPVASFAMIVGSFLLLGFAWGVAVFGGMAGALWVFSKVAGL